jgi:hypothetical protein
MSLSDNPQAAPPPTNSNRPSVYFTNSTWITTPRRRGMRKWSICAKNCRSYIIFEIVFF